MKTRLLIIIGIVVASAIIGSAYTVSVQTRCEDLLGETHYPRPLTFWNCYEYLQRVDNPPPQTTSELEMTPRYEKYLDENNELNFNLRYDKNGIIIDDLQRIFDWCDYTGEKPAHWYFDWNNQTHHIDSDNCEWEKK